MTLFNVFRAENPYNIDIRLEGTGKEWACHGNLNFYELHVELIAHEVSMVSASN